MRTAGAIVSAIRWGALGLTGVLGACGGPVAASSEPPPPADRIILTPGETQPIPAMANHRVTFVRVVADARCPRGVTCSESGPVSIELKLEPGDALRVLSILNRDVGGPAFAGIPSCTNIGTGSLRLRDVQPWPQAGAPTPSHAWRVDLVPQTQPCVKGPRQGPN